jgi:hypothetical protein
MSNGLITVADATGISDGMSVTWSGASFDSTKNYLTTAIDPVAGTVQLNPTPTSNIAASTTLNFISNSNGTAISHSYVGYEIRNTSTAESSTQTAEL